MGYIKFLKLFFLNLFGDLTAVCDSPIGKTVVKNNISPKQNLVGASKPVPGSATRTQVFSSSNINRSLSTISKRGCQNNRRPATPPKRKTKSIFDTSSEMSDISISEEQQHHQAMEVEPLVYRKNVRKDRNYNYKRYLARVLRDLNAKTSKPNLTISSNAMACMSDFMVDIFDKIAQEAGQQVKTNKTITLGDWDIKSAIQIVMPAELARQANIMAQQKLKNINGDKMKKKNKVVTFNPEIKCICPM